MFYSKTNLRVMPLTVLLFLFGVVTTTVCGAVRLPCGNEGPFPFYDPLEQQCCNGTLANLTQDGEDLKCCIEAEKLYKAESQICCGDEVIDRNSDQGCCDSSPYDRSTHRCCGSTLYTVNSFKGSCCGNQTYDNSTHECLDNNVGPILVENYMQRCGKDFINGTRVNTTNNGSRMHPECCGQMIIQRPDLYHCQDGRILLKGWYWCGNEPFNLKKQICCDGNVFNRTESSHCCGSNVIDLDTHRCCKKKPFTKSEYCCRGIIVKQEDAAYCLYANKKRQRWLLSRGNLE